MRKIVCTLLLVSISFVVFAQVELKGIKLGEQYSGENKIVGTFGTTPGIVEIKELKDGRVYCLIFDPSDDGENYSSISTSESERLIKKIEDYYKIKFSFTTKTNNETGSAVKVGIYKDESLEVKYVLKVVTKSTSIVTIFTLVISNEPLREISKQEKK